MHRPVNVGNHDDDKFNRRNNTDEQDADCKRGIVMTTFRPNKIRFGKNGGLGELWGGLLFLYSKELTDLFKRDKRLHQGHASAPLSRVGGPGPLCDPPAPSQRQRLQPRTGPGHAPAVWNHRPRLPAAPPRCPVRPLGPSHPCQVLSGSGRHVPFPACRLRIGVPPAQAAQACEPARAPA